VAETAPAPDSAIRTAPKRASAQVFNASSALS
jgi:hypothetical protein